MRKRSGLSRTQFLVQWVALPVLVIVSAAMFVGLVRNQVSIAAKQQELQSLKNQLAAQVTENAELSGTLDQGVDAIIERYAREQGYAKVEHLEEQEHPASIIKTLLHHAKIQVDQAAKTHERSSRQQVLGEVR